MGELIRFPGKCKCAKSDKRNKGREKAKVQEKTCTALACAPQHKTVDAEFDDDNAKLDVRYGCVVGTCVRAHCGGDVVVLGHMDDDDLACCACARCGLEHELELAERASKKERRRAAPGARVKRARWVDDDEGGGPDDGERVTEAELEPDYGTVDETDMREFSEKIKVGALG